VTFRRGNQLAVSNSSSSLAPTPNLLSVSRALYKLAKEGKSRYWRAEVLALVLAVGASMAPCITASVAFGLLAVATKVAAKLLISSSKANYRLAERHRRYDFEERTLGWPAPPRERADVHLASSSLLEIARTFEPRDSTYYANSGPPSTARLLSNLAESVFWTSRQMRIMEGIRTGQCWAAAVMVLATLVGLTLSQAGEVGVIVLKLLGILVTFLVALDVFGESRAFSRGTKECDAVLAALCAEASRSSPNRDEVIRLFIEYNCVLADLPIIPDNVYDKHGDRLTAAWTEFARDRFP
jgi:hypothetical protein